MRKLLDRLFGAASKVEYLKVQVDFFMKAGRCKLKNVFWIVAR